MLNEQHTQTCPSNPHNPLVAMQNKPTLHYVLNCAFLFYVFMCATLLESLVGFNARKFIMDNELPKHIIAFMLLFFTIGALNVMPSIPITLACTLLVYVWFLLMSKLPGSWSIIIVAVLAVAFVINEMVEHHYTPEWVFDVKKSAVRWSGTRWEKKEAGKHVQATQQRKRLRERLISISWVLGIVVLALTVVCTGWFHSPMRKRAIQGPYATKGRVWRFIYQPEAYQSPLALTSTSLAVEEKYEIHSITTAVLRKLQQDQPHLFAAPLR